MANLPSKVWLAILFKVPAKNITFESMASHNFWVIIPEVALQAFYALQKQLTSKLVMAFPKANRQYSLIMDAATGMADTPGGLRVILTQIDKDGNFYATSRQLKDHEKNYSSFLLEVAAAIWGMDFLNE